MKDWPDDGSTVGFKDLVDPLRDALDQMYGLVRVNADRDVDYAGYNVGALHVNMSADEALTAEYLARVEYDQGRDPAAVLIGIAVGVGIEQGRRAEREAHHQVRTPDDAWGLLAEWMTWWEDDPHVPPKLPNALQVRTAIALTQRLTGERT